MKKITLTVNLYYSPEIAAESVATEVYRALREYSFPSFEVLIAPDNADD